MITRRALLLIFVAVSLALGGCGGANMADVDGTVKLNGKPLDKIQVEFWPEGNGRRSMGTTNAQGKFTLTSDDGKKGAVVGWHKIVLKDVGIHGDKFYGRAGESMDLTKGKKPQVTSYGDPHKSSVRKEVTAGKCVIEIDLTAP